MAGLRALLAMRRTLTLALLLRTSSLAVLVLVLGASILPVLMLRVLRRGRWLSLIMRILLRRRRRLGLRLLGRGRRLSL